MFPWYHLFSEEISSLPLSIVFLYFFALITEEVFLISPCYSLELWIQMSISFLFSFAFCFFFFFFSQLILRPPQKTIFPFCISFCWGWSLYCLLKCQPTPVFLPGKSHGWWNLVGYSPWESQRVGYDWENYTFTQYHTLPSIVLQVLCLSDLIPGIYLSLPLYNHKAFDLGHNWMV